MGAREGGTRARGLKAEERCSGVVQRSSTRRWLRLAAGGAAVLVAVLTGGGCRDVIRVGESEVVDVSATHALVAVTFEREETETYTTTYTVEHESTLFGWTEEETVEETHTRTVYEEDMVLLALVDLTTGALRPLGPYPKDGAVALLPAHVVWSDATGRLAVATLDGRVTWLAGVDGFEVSHDGQRLAYVTDGTLRLRTLADGRDAVVAEGADEVLAVTDRGAVLWTTPGGTLALRLASGAGQTLAEVGEGEPLLVDSVDDEPLLVDSVDDEPLLVDGGRYVAVCGPGTTRVVDLLDGALVASLPVGGDEVEIDVSDDGMVTALVDGRLSVRRLVAGDPTMTTLADHVGGFVRTAGGNLAYVATNPTESTQRLVVWSPGSGAEVVRVERVESTYGTHGGPLVARTDDGVLLRLVETEAGAAHVDAVAADTDAVRLVAGTADILWQDGDAALHVYRIDEGLHLDVEPGDVAVAVERLHAVGGTAPRYLVADAGALYALEERAAGSLAPHPIADWSDGALRDDYAATLVW